MYMHTYIHTYISDLNRAPVIAECMSDWNFCHRPSDRLKVFSMEGPIEGPLEHLGAMYGPVVCKGC